MGPEEEFGVLPAAGYARQKQLVGSKKEGIPLVIPFSAATLGRRVTAWTFRASVKLSIGRHWLARRAYRCMDG